MKIVFDDNHLCRALYGERELHLRILEETLDISVNARGNELQLSGADDKLTLAEEVLNQLYLTLKKGFSVKPDDIRRGIKGLLRDRDIDLSKIFTDVIFVNRRNRNITPRGHHQKLYVDAMRKNDLVFGIGPAGTGKTYLAMAMAVAALTKKEVERIILTRPAVEAGERLGFLPGTLQDKVDPYLRPLYDALHDMLDAEKVDGLLERGVVEVAPLAYMRGRTLNNAFVVLDEAQNTTAEQMKMFLTRLGFDSKAVITGDVTQIDLPRGASSGLVESQRILKGVPGLAFCYFDEADVVRHPLVQRIILAYQRADEEKRSRYEQNRRASQERTNDAPKDEPPSQDES